MNTDLYERIAEFLSDFMCMPGGLPIPPDPVYIRDSISVLISEGFYTADELKQEALERWSVIIPERFFLTESAT